MDMSSTIMIQMRIQLYWMLDEDDQIDVTWRLQKSTKYKLFKQACGRRGQLKLAQHLYEEYGYRC
jgi:hypothetical protein